MNQRTARHIVLNSDERDKVKTVQTLLRETFGLAKVSQTDAIRYMIRNFPLPPTQEELPLTNEASQDAIWLPPTKKS